MGLLFNNPDEIKNICYEFTPREDFFNMFSTNNISNNILTFTNCFFKHNIYKNDGLNQYIKECFKHVNKSYLYKYNCVVTNITNGTYEYINGTNNNIENFILASSSPRIICPAITINKLVYNDGHLLHTYPIDNLKNSTADIKLLVGYDIENHTKNDAFGNNMISYLNKLIDISIKNNNNIRKMPKYIDKYNIIPIKNTVNFNCQDINPKNISLGFNLGIEAADKFANEYLL